MCWSDTVSLTFVIIETIASVFLWFRNDSFDRVGVFLGLPLITQELLQYFLWLNIGVSPDQCSDKNRILSIIVQLVICSIAFTLSIVSRLSWNSDVPIQIKKQWNISVFLQIIVYISFAAYFINGYLNETVPLCTYPGTLIPQS
jgi:hypothetical protein